MPNIVGEIGFQDDDCFLNPTITTGSFYKGAATGLGVSGGASGAGYKAGFNASRSNAIYGSSDTVMVDSYNQPVAIYLGS